MREPIVYKDVNLKFMPNPLSGDILTSTNMDAIKSSLRHIFKLRRFDIPFDPDKCSGIDELLFSNPNQLTEAQLYKKIEWIVKKMEPRISISELKVRSSSTGQEYIIDLTYKIRSLGVSDTFNFTVQRVR